LDDRARETKTRAEGLHVKQSSASKQISLL
jgi:hypothetical protein